MAKIRRFTLGRAMTISVTRWENDKPHFEIDVELEDGDDVYDEIGSAIQLVNATLIAISESGSSEEEAA